MPVKTTSFNESVGSSIRPFNIPRMKTAASSFLRQAYSPSTNESKEHNKLISPCNLPEEVTRKIFLACAQLSIHDSNSGNDRWSWVNISYVCSSWRRVALDYQDLWRHIDFSSSTWHAITSRRAKMSCLRIITPVTNQNIRLLHRTLQLAHRIQDIHLTSSPQKIQPLLELLAHPNPALESLIVDIHTPRNSYIDAFDPPAFPVSGPPLTNLKYLELHNTPFYLLTSRCTSLTQFHLHDLAMTERPTLRYFLFMLEQLTELQVLTLDRAFPINVDLDDVQALERPITFPRLESISLVGSVPEIARILKCITIPSSAQLVGKICTLSGLQSNICKLTEALTSHSCGGVDSLPLETLVLTGHESGSRFIDGLNLKMDPQFRQSLRIRGFRADCGRGGAAIDVTISPEESYPSDQGMITTISAIWKALPLAHIHTLGLQDVDIITQKTWSQFLRTLPSLHVLDITGSAPSGLVWALLLNARSHGQGLRGDGQAQRLLVPRLADIYLHNVDCSSGGFMVAPTAPVNSHCDLDDSRFLDVLVACLGHRRRFGLCLRSLSVARCNFVLRNTLDDARKAVSYLICDFILVAKDEDVDATSPARYRIGRDCWKPRHYHRLRTLVELDADF